MPRPRRHDDSLSLAAWHEIDRVCDQFEAAWANAKKPPSLEAYLVSNWPPPQYRALLQGLLIVELDMRVARGDQPDRQQYYQRFASDKEAVNAAFLEQQPTPEVAQPRQRSAERQLLFGLLALQNGLVSHQEFVTAFARWTKDKSQPLYQVLIANEVLSVSACEVLNQLVDLHVDQRDGDTTNSLMILCDSDLEEARKAIAELDEPDLQATMSIISEASSVRSTMGPSSSVGKRFRILRPLEGGEGGMGVISLAHDNELDRIVALKQIRSDKSDSLAYRNKFQFEAEVTGNLEHPGIVPIYGLGTDASARPYYTMRLIRGDNLKSAIDEFHNKLNKGTSDYDSVEFHGLIDRLLDVSEAVAYAHSRGVLHRDLKPGNILVGRYGETLVIDWGLARAEKADVRIDAVDIDALGPIKVRSGSDVGATQDGMVMGTLGYAPPEQVSGHVDQIDGRSDVYALGAILYRVLSGATTVAIRDKNDEPRERLRITQDVIAGRIVPPRQLIKAVPKGLAAVCMMALSTRRENRYATAADFIEELKRWKADQPVEAVPDSLVDRLARFARKHRAAVLSSGALLLGITLIATIAALLVNESRKAEIGAKLAEMEAREQEEKARVEAETLSNRNQQVVDAFVGAFQSPNPANKEVTSKMTALQVLKQALARLEDREDLEQDPLTKATLLDAIGTSLSSLGVFDQAILAQRTSHDLRKMELGADHVDTLSSLSNLAYAYQMSGQWGKALPLWKETLTLMKAKLGDDHRETLASMNNLAYSLARAGRLNEALPLLDQTLQLRRAKLGPQDPDTLMSLNNLAMAYKVSGRLDDALPLFLEAFESRKAILGADHPSTLISMNNLGLAYEEARRFEEALPLLEQSLELTKAKLGPNHPDTMLSIQNLAFGYESAGRLDEAIALYEEALERMNSELAPDNPTTITTMCNLASGYRQAGRLNEAIPLFEEALRRAKSKFGPNHPQTLTNMNDLALGYQDAGYLDDAVVLFEATLEISKKIRGPTHPSTLVTMNNLASSYLGVGRVAEALPLYETTVQMMDEQDHPNTLSAVRGLMSASLQVGKFEQARAVVERWIAAIEQSENPDRRQLAIARVWLAEALLGTHRAAEASEQIEAALGSDSLSKLSVTLATNIKGAILATKEDWETAEPLLVESTESLVDRLSDMKIGYRWYVSRACERVIILYENWNRPDKVSSWKATLSNVNSEIERLRNKKAAPKKSESGQNGSRSSSEQSVRSTG